MKKKLCVFVAVLLLISALSLVPTADVGLTRGSGDVDLNGEVDHPDIIALKMYFNGETELSEQQLANADVSGDGKVTIYDYSLIYAEYYELLDASEIVLTDVKDNDACKAGIIAQSDNSKATHYVAGKRFEIVAYVTNPLDTTEDFLELELNYDANEFTFVSAYTECSDRFLYYDCVDENGSPIGKVAVGCDKDLNDQPLYDMHDCYPVYFSFIAKESGINTSSFVVDNVSLCSYGKRTRYLFDSVSLDLPKHTFDINITASMSNLIAEETFETTIEIGNITAENGVDKIGFTYAWGGNDISGGYSSSVVKLLSVPADDCVITQPEGWVVNVSKNANGFLDVNAFASESAAPMMAGDTIVIELEFKTAKSASESISFSAGNIIGELDGTAVYGRSEHFQILQHGLVYIRSEDGKHFIVYGNHGAPSELEIPETATYYGITLPVKEIVSGAFWGLELDSLTIPASIEYISANAFRDSTVADIYCAYSRAPSTWEEGCFEPSGAIVHWGDVEPDSAPDPVIAKLGDVNDDGAINQYDYILVKRHYFGTRYLTEDEIVRGDANTDGKVDQYDYILIARHYFGTFVIG